MGVIRRLNEETVSKIAAGEVIERPSSVVKELVENSVDAGSSEIAVLIEEGGRRRIRISDNGVGMSPEDVLASLDRHATSKLTNIDDFDALHTMGFRGEALYSVAAVSRMTILSRHRDSDIGFRLVVEAGRVVDEGPAPRVPGTTIDVENLFFNLPARMKFMKTARSETQSISGIIARFLIMFPETAFTLEHNDVAIFQASSGETTLDRLRLIFGADVTRNVRETEAEIRKSRVRIFFTPPDFTFPNRRFQMYFVNGRAVRDRTISTAVDVAYKGITPPARFPLAVAMIDVPPAEVDVNVHPQKHEVRFVNQHEIHSLIYRALRSRFVADAPVEPSRPFTLVGSAPPASAPAPAPPPWREEPAPQRAPQPPPVREELKLSSPPSPRKEEPVAASDDSSEPAVEARRIPKFQVLGQFYNTYMLVDIEGTPVFIDQHVASERILFNKLRKSNGPKPSQMLLLGRPVEVPHYAYPVLMENIDRIREAGIEIEPFGERAFVIRGVLHNAGSFDPLSLLVAVAEELSAAPFSAPDHSLTDRLLTVAACRMAVQAGRALSMEEMTQLTGDLLAEELNRTCPHGRPIIHEVPKETLHAWFKR